MADSNCARGFRNAIQAARSAYTSCVLGGVLDPTRCVQLYWATARAALKALSDCLARGGDTEQFTAQDYCYLELFVAILDAYDAYETCRQVPQNWAKCDEDLKNAYEAAWDAWEKCLKSNGVKPPNVPGPRRTRPHLFPPVLSPVDITLPRPGVLPPKTSELPNPKTPFRDPGNMSIIWPVDMFLNYILSQGGGGTVGRNLAGQ